MPVDVVERVRAVGERVERHARPARRSSGCRLSWRRTAIRARATGFWNGRSGRVNSASALAPVWPGASLATMRPSTGRPAQGCAVRSCTSAPCAVFGLPASGDGHDQRRRVRAVAQPQLGLQRGDAVIVARPARAGGSAAVGAAADAAGAGRLGEGGDGRLVRDQRQRPGRRPCRRRARPRPGRGRRAGGEVALGLPARGVERVGTARLRRSTRERGLARAAGDADRQVRARRAR